MADQAREEYVESELARRKRQAAESFAREEEQENNNGFATGRQFDPSQPGTAPQIVDSQRVLQGKLFEVDLGDDARARNIAMTERARRRLQGQIDEEDVDSADGRNRKVRIGRDGKPWRPRNRRNSDDIKRDDLVEAFLSENKSKLFPDVEFGQLLTAFQSICMTFHPSRLLQRLVLKRMRNMLQTIALLSSSDGTLWMQWHKETARGGRLQMPPSLRLSLIEKIFSRGRSSVVVEMPEQLHGKFCSESRSQSEDDFPYNHVIMRKLSVSAF